MKNKFFSKILNSINFKIIVPPFLLFAIIVILALTIGGDFFDKASTTKIQNELNTETEIIKERLSSNAIQLGNIATIYSQIPSLQNILSQYSVSNNKDSLTRLVKNLFKDKKFNYSFDIITVDGQKLFSNNSSFRKKYIKNEIIFNSIKRKKLLVDYSSLYNQDYLIVSSPVMNRNDAVGSVVITKSLTNIINNLYLSKGIYIQLFNNKNKLVYASDGIDRTNIFRQKFENGFIKIEDFIVKKFEIISNGKSIENAFLYKSTVDIDNSVLTMIIYLLLFSLGAFIVGGFIYSYGIYKTLLQPIKIINDKILIVARGESTTKIATKSKDQLGQIANSVDNMIEYRKRTAAFANHIGEGILDEEFEVVSDKDEIGNALLHMRKELREAKEEEQNRNIEEEKRNWATKGHAEFGDILRQNNDDIAAFSINILRNLINYTESNQGGLFIYNDSDEKNHILELVASYAYNRQKFINKEIKIGEGLVGTCAIEKEVIYLTDVPKDYIEINSGLGDASPRNILLVPLKVEDKLFGVLELASFNYYEDYQQEFVMKLGESIASSLNSTKINIMTAELLEQANQQQEEMKAQEEELRQNMEEMLATQEESARKEAEKEGLYQAINNNLLVANFDLKGNVIDINDNYATLFGVDKQSFIGVNYNQISSESEGISNKELWSKINTGQVVDVKTKIISSEGNIFWLQQTFAPVKNENGEVYKVINISSDITEERANRA